MRLTLALVTSAFVLTALGHSAQAQQTGRWFPGKLVQTRIAKLAWQRHANQQLSHQNREGQQGLLAHRMTNVGIKNVRLSPNGHHVQFQGRYTLSLGQAGQGRVSSFPMQMRRPGLLHSVRILLKREPPPLLTLRPESTQLEQP